MTYKTGNNTTIDGTTVIVSSVKNNRIKGFMRISEDRLVEMVWNTDGTTRGTDRLKSLAPILKPVG